MAKRQAANLDVVKDQTAYTQSLEETVKWLTHSLSIMNQETADNNPQKVSLKQPATIIYRVLGDSLLWLFREPEAREFYQKAVSLGLWEDAWCRPVRPAATIHKSVGIFPNNILQEIIGPFEAAMPRIHKEFNQFIISKKTQGAPLKLEPEAAGLSHFKKWNYLLISNNGQVQPAVCESFPALCEVISSLPETRLKNGQIKFSILAAGAHIKPHSGPTNRRLRMHCGMTVPPSTEIRIRTETRTWEKNKCFVFDESCEHEVWNNSTDPRVVLIVDFVNPLLEDRSDFLQEVQPPYTKKPHRETLIKNFNAIQARWLASEECPIKT